MLVVGGTAALFPALFGPYALSGAGVIRRLPLLRTFLLAVSSHMPARRAARIHPTIALRTE